MVLGRLPCPADGLGCWLLGGLGKLSDLPRMDRSGGKLATQLVGGLGRLLGMPVGRHLGRPEDGVSTQRSGRVGRLLTLFLGRRLASPGSGLDTWLLGG